MALIPGWHRTSGTVISQNTCMLQATNLAHCTKDKDNLTLACPHHAETSVQRPNDARHCEVVNMAAMHSAFGKLGSPRALKINSRCNDYLNAGYHMWKPGTCPRPQRANMYTTPEEQPRRQNLPTDKQGSYQRRC